MLGPLCSRALRFPYMVHVFGGMEGLQERKTLRLLRPNQLCTDHHDDCPLLLIFLRRYVYVQHQLACYQQCSSVPLQRHDISLVAMTQWDTMRGL